MKRTGWLILSDREARGIASRALCKSKLRKHADYWSRKSLVANGWDRQHADPRYEVNLTDNEADLLREALVEESKLLGYDDAFSAGIDFYHD